MQRAYIIFLRRDIVTKSAAGTLMLELASPIAERRFPRCKGHQLSER